MMASQTLLSRLNTHNYHNPLDATLNRLANKLPITTSLCPSSRTLKAVDCGEKKNNTGDQNETLLWNITVNCKLTHAGDIHTTVILVYMTLE